MPFASVVYFEGQIKVKLLKFSPFLLCHYPFKLCLVLQKCMNLSCPRSPDSCFENSSQTHYDATGHYVRTHKINTQNSHLFGILQIFQFISFGCVGICYFHFGIFQFYWNHIMPSLPLRTLFQLHAFQFSSFQFG